MCPTSAWRVGCMAVVAALAIAACGSEAATPTPPPSPSMTPMGTQPVTIDPTPVAVPSVTSPFEEPLLAPTWAPAQLPAETGTVHIAAGADGDLYVLVDEPKVLADGPPSRATFARLDPAGGIRPGWPVSVDGWFCAWEWGETRPLGPLVATDGSVRALCTSDEETTTPDGEVGLPLRIAVGLAADGSPLNGWPVDLRGTGWHTPAVIDGTTLVVAANVTLTDAQGNGTGSDVWVVAIGGDGTRRDSPHLDATRFVWPVLGPDGIARMVSFAADGMLLAMTLEGVVDGWPATLGPGMSGPAAGPDGTTVAAIVTGSTTRTVILDPRGVELDSGSDALRVVQSPEWSGAGPHGGPAIPLVASDGTVYLLEQRDDEFTVMAIDRAGQVLAGFPVSLPGQLEEQGRCDREETGCGVWTVQPALAPDGTVYLALRRAGQGASGSLVAITRSGGLVSNWPVLAGDAREAIRDLKVGPDGTVFAVVVDRAAEPRSWSVLALRPDGSEIYRTQLVVSDRQ